MPHDGSSSLPFGFPDMCLLIAQSCASGGCVAGTLGMGDSGDPSNFVIQDLRALFPRSVAVSGAASAASPQDDGLLPCGDLGYGRSGHTQRSDAWQDLGSYQGLEVPRCWWLCRAWYGP